LSKLAALMGQVVFPAGSLIAAAAAVLVLSNGHSLAASSAVDDTQSVSPAQVHAAVVAAAAIKRVPGDLQPDLVHASNDNERLHNEDCAAARAKQDATFGECVYGDRGSKREVALFGDSHAGMWFDGLKAAATAAHWKFQIFYKAGCPIVELNFYSSRDRSFKGCGAWRDSAIAAIRKIRPTLVVVTSGTFEQPVASDRFANASEWAQGLTHTLNRLKEPKTRLAVLGDIPRLAQSAPECLAAHQSDAQACATPVADAYAGVLVQAERDAAKATGALRVNVAPWLCAATCPAIVGHILVYRNQFHISATYSIFLSGALRASLGL
jgi:hypothetical protein